jgi:hypothetical protein
MKPKPIEFVEAGRVMSTAVNKRLGSTKDYGNNGIFVLADNSGEKFNVIASDGEMWEHVSVSLQGHSRLPTWDEMCWVKDLFWNEEEWVVQYHPGKSQYVNTSPYVLHLWKPIGIDLPLPPMKLVGVPGLEIKY